MSRSRKSAERIREEVPIIEVLADYGYDVDTRGGDREQQFSCDLHGDGQDSKPSARVYPDNNQFFCFACGRSRDVLALVMEKEALSFWDAIRKIEKRHGLSPLPWEPDEEDATRRDVVDFVFYAQSCLAFQTIVNLVFHVRRLHILTPCG